MDQLEEIKAKVDVVQLISEYLPLQKAGRNFKTACPFHSEKTPSFIVSPERQIWKCFGCGLGGDVFHFLMEYERMDFGEALRLLAKRTGVILKSYQPTEDEAKKEKLYQVNHLAAEFFHYLLLNHPSGKPALDYVLQRGISRDSLKLFKIGYSPNLWDGLQKYLVGKKGFSPSDLENAGLIIPSRQSSASFYDRFRHRLMFPLTDHRGNICGFAGRVLDPEVRDLPAGRQEAKYVNTPETLVYHKSDLLYPLNLTKEEIKKNNQAIVVEGELDAISSFQVGVKNVVAIKGSALTENQVKLLKRFTESLILALDADIAGDSAARRGIEIADKEGLNIRVIELEKYKDPDEAAQKDPQFYKEKVKKAVPFYEFLIDSAFKRYPESTPEDKRKIGAELVPVLARIENEIIKNHYVRQLADRLRVSEDSILAQIRKVSAGMTVSPSTSSVLKTSQSRQEVLETYLLALYFQGEKTEQLVKEQINLFKIPSHQRILDFLVKHLEKNSGKYDSQSFFASLPPELREVFNSFYLVDLGEKVEADWFDKELKKGQKELAILLIKEELATLSQTIKEQEKAGQTESESCRQTQEKFRQLSQNLASILAEKEV